MRLTEKEIQIFKNQVLSFDKNAVIYLFGSRANDKAKGGDIDLLIVSDKIGFPEKIKIRAGIFNQMEEQKLDLIVRKDLDDSFVKSIENQLICLHPKK
jgi:predicted nucleotidyltransferase